MKGAPGATSTFVSKLGELLQLNCYDDSTIALIVVVVVVTSLAGAVAKYCNECICVCVCLSVCPRACLPNHMRNLN